MNGQNPGGFFSQSPCFKVKPLHLDTAEHSPV